MPNYEIVLKKEREAEVDWEEGYTKYTYFLWKLMLNNIYK